MSEDEQMDEQMASPTSPKKPIQLVLDSDEEDVDEEPETQPYDQDCHLANSEVYVTFMLIVLPLKDSYFWFLLGSEILTCCLYLVFAFLSWV